MPEIPETKADVFEELLEEWEQADRRIDGEWGRGTGDGIDEAVMAWRERYTVAAEALKRVEAAFEVVRERVPGHSAAVEGLVIRLGDGRKIVVSTSVDFGLNVLFDCELVDVDGTVTDLLPDPAPTSEAVDV